MTPRSPLTTPFNRRRLVLASGGAILAAPFLSHFAASAQDAISVTMLTDTAGIGDESFSDMAKAGGDRATEELGIEFRILESQTPADYVQNLTDAAKKSDLIIAA
ncbi:MAG TPA: hypothetical protein VNZ55_13410, partial [Thermomicrobiales bacterium]|nr:hypothetical protein [Thermomicrobiales bacterium]